MGMEHLASAWGIFGHTKEMSASLFTAQKDASPT
jgi:hypothetical protein